MRIWNHWLHPPEDVRAPGNGKHRWCTTGSDRSKPVCGEKVQCCQDSWSLKTTSVLGFHQSMSLGSELNPRGTVGLIVGRSPMIGGSDTYHPLVNLSIGSKCCALTNSLTQRGVTLWWPWCLNFQHLGRMRYTWTWLVSVSAHSADNGPFTVWVLLAASGSLFEEIHNLQICVGVYFIKSELEEKWLVGHIRWSLMITWSYCQDNYCKQRKTLNMTMNFGRKPPQRQ